MEKIHCIYGIKDLRNNKVIYIGQTKNFRIRKYNHFGSKLRPIDKYMFEQCRENFDMYILKKLSDDISKDEILKFENEFIKKYNTIESGLNKCRSGNISKDNKEYFREYSKSDKWKEYQRDYYNTEKWKEYHREYNKSEKWKKYMRNYYLKKKQEKQNEIQK